MVRRVQDPDFSQEDRKIGRSEDRAKTRVLGFELCGAERRLRSRRTTPPVSSNKTFRSSDLPVEKSGSAHGRADVVDRLPSRRAWPSGATGDSASELRLMIPHLLGCQT